GRIDGRMSETLEKGWKPIPLPLKILFVALVLWLVGYVINLPNLYENGMPLFGTFVYGMSATFLPLLLDSIGPVVFLFTLWSRKSWAVNWAFAYNGIFILNDLVAFFTVRKELGTPQILVPTIASLVFLAIIFWKRSYFKQTR
ncbi:hypothetical protein, partial [Litorivivens sp.]|uniref:hypothetical protein n=1 Tax=Litorivivens sp. TaxID=2020868 RepID=UPI0035697923